MKLKTPAVVSLILVLFTAHTRAATPEQVEQALERAKQYLYSQQNAAGHWDTDAADPKGRPNQFTAGQWGGPTSLAVYALLAAGESPHDPKLSRAVEFMLQAEIQGVYALAMRMQALLLLPHTPQTRRVMQNDAQRMMALMRNDGPGRGHFDYIPRAGSSTGYSHSRSQYGVLGIWAASQMGMEIPQRFWQEVEQAWVRHQDPSGGWTYMRADQTQHALTPGMTAAGVASLFIANDYLYANAGINCRGNINNPAIDKGLKWISDNFDKVATSTTYSRDFPYITLYAVERIGIASGLKYFNGIDWYEKGAAWLIKTQQRNGSWSSRSTWVGANADTGFAMLFLVKGRAPVIFNKLDYTTDTANPAHWNQRPRDVANLTRWISSNLERDLNWQIVTLDSPLADWHDSPILYISGSQELRLEEPHRQKLKQYIEQGGTIFAVADCGAAPFANSVRRIMTELFPQYSFRELTVDHLMYNNQFPRERWRTKPSVLALGNGVREFVLVLPQADPGRAWQLRQTVREELWQLPMNVLLHSSDFDLRYKGQGHLVERDDKVQPQRTVQMARVSYDGNWDPEPAGWRRMGNILHNQHRVTLEVRPAKAPAEAIAPAKVAHLTGTEAFELSAETRTAVRDYVLSGGLLLIDATGGSAAFAQAAERELQQLFPEGKLERIVSSHAIYSAAGALPPMEYRRFSMRTLGGLQPAPRLQGITLDGRLAVVFSREDLSTALVGHPVDGIIGYAPASAAALVSSIILHAAGSAEQPKAEAAAE
jgi:hypothetical protein